MNEKELNDVVDIETEEEVYLDELEGERQFTAKDVAKIGGYTLLGGLAFKGASDIVKGVVSKIKGKNENKVDDSAEKKPFYKRWFKKAEKEVTETTENPTEETK